MNNEVYSPAHQLKSKGIGTWEINLENEHIYWSDSTKQIFNLESHFEPDFATAFLFFSEGETRRKLKRALDRLISDHVSFDMEVRIKTTGGTSKWARVIGHGDFEDDVCKRIIGMIDDITEYVRVREQLKLRENQFRNAFEYAAIGVTIESLEGKWERVNKSFCDIVGYSEQELLELNYREITHPDDIDLDEQQKKLLLDGKIESFHMEKRYFHKSGRAIWVLLSVALVLDANGRPLHFITQMQNISERKELHQKLEMSERQFRGSFENAAIGMALVSSSGKWLEVNKSLCRMLGYTEEELLALTVQEVTHPDDLELDLMHMRQLLEGKLRFYNMEKRYFHKDGHVIWSMLSVSIVQGHNEKTKYFVSQLQDITEQKETEQKLRQSLNIVSEQNNRLYNFAHIATHNLRNHASKISGLTELIQELSDPEKSELQELVTLLKASSAGLAETINHLNEVVSIQTRIDDQRKILPVREYVEKAINTVQESIKKHNINVYNNVSPGVKVSYNPAYLESIILNLLTNGIKYRHPDRVPEIAFNTYTEDQHLVLEVKDNGLGIDLSRYGKQLFGMYKTFHDNPDAKGIGLFITKNQVEAMGGKIEVESEVDQGTVFRIYLT
jgi:PAS domain S-box-containing protein